MYDLCSAFAMAYMQYRIIIDSAIRKIQLYCACKGVKWGFEIKDYPAAVYECVFLHFHWVSKWILF